MEIWLELELVSYRDPRNQISKLIVLAEISGFAAIFAENVLGLTFPLNLRNKGRRGDRNNLNYAFHWPLSCKFTVSCWLRVGPNYENEPELYNRNRPCVTW